MSARIEGRLARPEDDDELRRLLRENPMPGDIALTLEREPSFFLAATVEGDVHHTVTGRDPTTGKLAGLGSIATRELYLDGAPRRFGYLSQLRMDNAFRYHGKLLRRGFELLRDLDGSLDVPGYVTTIFEDNAFARAALEKDRPFKPCYRRVGTLVTLALPLWRRPRVGPPTGVEIRAARAEDLDDLAACVERNYRRHALAPVWRVDDLVSPERVRGLAVDDFTVALRAGRIVGCLARWDQQGFKQTVVRGYGGKIALARPLLNIGASIFHWPRLPDVGQRLSQAHLSHVAVDDDDAAITGALVAHALTAATGRGYAYLLLGLCEGHPALAAIRRRMLHIEYRALVYVAHWADRPAPRVEAPLHLELATL